MLTKLNLKPKQIRFTNDVTYLAEDYNLSVAEFEQALAHLLAETITIRKELENVR